MPEQELELTEDTFKLVQRARAAAHAAAAYNKAFDVYWEKLTVLTEDEFWPILERYRILVLMYRFQYKRTNGLDQAAKELFRKAWCGEIDVNLATMCRFAKTYGYIAEVRSPCLPTEFGGGDKYSDAKDNLPLGGKDIGTQGQYGSIAMYEAAVTMGVAEMKDELEEVLQKLVKFITYGENYNRTSLRDAARYYLAAALREVECKAVDDPRYIRIDVDRDTMATVLDKTDGPLTVQTKLDDEGIVLDVIDCEDEVIDSAWQLYAEAGVTVTPESQE